MSEAQALHIFWRPFDLTNIISKLEEPQKPCYQLNTMLNLTPLI
uniref:Uncharacterized protein n=1 Tax=Arundo donax TaxID=35708 RepID=A0A0A8ZPR1_ARUDO